MSRTCRYFVESSSGVKGELGLEDKEEEEVRVEESGGPLLMVSFSNADVGIENGLCPWPTTPTPADASACTAVDMDGDDDETPPLTGSQEYLVGSALINSWDSVRMLWITWEIG
jgi:hypothetical protein